MLIYEFYKPSCLDFNINDLENMRLEEVIDYFEILEDNSKLVFYWRGMKKNERKNFQFSLNRRFTLNDCFERTGQIYLYYDKKETVLYKRP